jgi:hypothetical protein
MLAHRPIGRIRSRRPGPQAVERARVAFAGRLPAVGSERRRDRSASVHLERREKSRIVLETCSEAFAIADAALSFGREVRVVPCSLVRSLGVGARGLKTDRVTLRS